MSSLFLCENRAHIAFLLLLLSSFSASSSKASRANDASCSSTSSLIAQLIRSIHSPMHLIRISEFSADIRTAPAGVKKAGTEEIACFSFSHLFSSFSSLLHFPSLLFCSSSLSFLSTSSPHDLLRSFPQLLSYSKQPEQPRGRLGWRAAVSASLSAPVANSISESTKKYLQLSTYDQKKE